MKHKIQVFPLPKVLPIWAHKFSKYPEAIRVSMSDGKVLRYVLDVPQPAPVFREQLDNYTELCVGYPKNKKERVCEWCHNSFPENEMIETEFGYLCGDCFRERMDAEDRENNG